MSEYIEVVLSSRPQNRISQPSSYFPSSTFNGYNEGNLKHESKPSASAERRDALHELRYRIESSIDLEFRDKSFCGDDGFLQRFIYASKGDVDVAYNLMKNYLRFKQNNRNLLNDLNIFDERIQIAIMDGNPAVLEQRDRRGRKVLTFTAAHWNVSKYSIHDIYRALLLTLDKLLEDVQNQMLGFVIVVDWTNCTLQQSLSFTPSTLKLLIDGLQVSINYNTLPNSPRITYLHAIFILLFLKDCMPVKFKGIHFIAQPYYVDMVLTVIKPFIREKMKERFHMHGTNMSSLHKIIAKDVLPPELGGEAANHNCLEWFNFLVHSSQMSETPNSYRLIKTNVYSTTANHSSISTTTKSI